MRHTDPRSAAKTPEFVIQHILVQLREFFNSSMKVPGPFFETLIVPRYLSAASPSGDSVYQELLEQSRNDPAAFGNHGPMATLYVACAYCNEARLALAVSDLNRAWSLISDAQYWCGLTMANKGIPAEFHKTVAAVKRSQARKGGLGKSAKSNSLKEEAFRLVREQCPPALWPSNRSAAMAVSAAVRDFAKQIGESMSPDRADITVAEWLPYMPGRESYFRDAKPAKAKPPKA